MQPGASCRTRTHSNQIKSLVPVPSGARGMRETYHTEG